MSKTGMLYGETFSCKPLVIIIGYRSHHYSTGRGPDHPQFTKEMAFFETAPKQMILIIFFIQITNKQ
jgi:hypothetical protein